MHFRIRWRAWSAGVLAVLVAGTLFPPAAPPWTAASIGLGVWTLPTHSSRTPQMGVPAVGVLLETDPTDTSFAVALTSTIEATGTLIYGTSPVALTRVAYDDRDAPAAAGGPPATYTASTVHRFTLTGLARHTIYYVEPVLGAAALTDGPGQPFTATTADLDPGTLPPLPSVVDGSVALAPGAGPASGAVLVVAYGVQADGVTRSAPQSVLVPVVAAANTPYVFPTGNPPATTPDGSGYFVAGAGVTFSVMGWADLAHGLAVGGAP